MNDEIQVTNRELLIACYAEICGVLDAASVRPLRWSLRFAWRMAHGTSRSTRRRTRHAGLGQRIYVLGFDQTRDDPHMQRALVDVRRFVSEGLATARHARKEFDDTYGQLKGAFGDNLQKFLQLAQEKYDNENYEASSWSSSSDSCW